MNPGEAMRLENEAGDLLRMGGDPRRVLGVLTPFAGEPRTRASWLRSSAWLALARREGPSTEAESWLRFAFEAALVDRRVNPKIYEPDDDMLLLGVGYPFTAWFEYLVMFGCFAEAREARARVTPILGASFFAKPRRQNRALVEALAAMATPEIFRRALQPDFLPHLAAVAECEISELRVTRGEGLLPRGAGMLETISVAFPVPLFSGEPLWFTFARVIGVPGVRVFTLDWFPEEWSARPSLWARNHYLSERDYGTAIAPGAAPRPNLGPASPYLPTFMAYVAQHMMNIAHDAPPISQPRPSVPPLRAPIPTLAPRSVPPAPQKSQAGLVALLAIGLIVVAAAFGVWQLKRGAEARARLRACTSLGLPASACKDFLRSAPR